MARLEDLTKRALVHGAPADRAVKVVDLEWHGSSAIALIRTGDSAGKADHGLLLCDDEPRLTVEPAGRACSMDADWSRFRPVSEPQLISVAYPFDPSLAVQTSERA